MYDTPAAPAFASSGGKPSSSGPFDCTMELPGSPCDFKCAGIARSFAPVCDVSTNAFSSRIALSLRVNSPTDFFVLLNRYAKRETLVAALAPGEFNTPASLADFVVAAGDWPVTFDPGGADVFPLSSPGAEGWGEEVLFGGGSFCLRASHWFPKRQK